MKIFIYEGDAIRYNFDETLDDIPYAMYPCTQRELDLLIRLRAQGEQMQELLEQIKARGSVDEYET